MDENKIVVEIYEIRYLKNIAKLLEQITDDIEIIFKAENINASCVIETTSSKSLSDEEQSKIIHSFMIDCSLIESYQYNTDEEYVSIVINTKSLHEIIKTIQVTQGLNFVLPSNMDSGYFIFKTTQNKTTKIELKCCETTDILDVSNLNSYEPNLKVYPKQLIDIFKMTAKNTTVEIQSTEDRRGLEFIFNKNNKLEISSSSLHNKDRYEFLNLLEYDKPFKGIFNVSDLVSFKTKMTVDDNLCEFRLIYDCGIVFTSDIGSYGTYTMTMLNGKPFPEDD